MAKNYDELTNFTQGSDNGDDNSGSIQPIAGGEWASDITTDRPHENLRKRSEVIRSRLEELSYFADYDRALVLRSDLGFEFQQTTSGGTSYRLNGFGSGDLWVYPSLTPGRLSGGRLKGGRVFSTQGGNWLPYAGTLLVNDLTLTCNSDFVGQRGYADGTTFDAPSTALTLGANGIKVQLVANSGLAGGLGSLSAVWSGNPKRKVVITYGTAAPATQLSDVINFINSDTTSGGTYGLANFFRATTTGSLSNPPPTIADGQVQGQYDSEAFQVTLAQLTAFFNISANQLSEGEGLAIGFPPGPVELGAGAKGGRRQSIWDLPTNRTGGKSQNTTPAVSTNLFNTAREPEKIPGSIPIGKMINGKFVFIDGTTVDSKDFGVGTPGDSAILLGESGSMIARFSSHVDHTHSGAFYIGYAASTGLQWANTDPFDHPNVAEAIDSIVSDLSSITANHSGADRIGADPIAGSATVGNLAKSVTAGTLGAQIFDMLNAGGSSSAAGGINARVSEFGHSLHGKKPLLKDFRETGPENLTTGGGQLTRAMFPNPALDSLNDGTTWHDAHVMLEPLLMRVGGVDKLILNNPIAAGTLGGFSVVMSGLTTPPDFTNIFRRIPQPPGIHADTGAIDHGILVEIKGLTGTSTHGNGFYAYLACDEVTSEVILGLVDDITTPVDFTGANFSAATITFYKTTILGRAIAGTQLRAFLHQATDEAAAKLYMCGRDEAGAVQVNNYLHVYRSARTVGNSAVLMARYGTDGFTINERNPTTDAITNVREAKNILVTGDKALLAGVETSTPVDATLSHHHGGTYNQILFVDPAAINPVTIDWTTLATVPTTPTEFQTSLTGSFIPVGFDKIGTILSIYVTFTPTGAGDTSFNIHFGVVAGSPGSFVEYGNVGNSFNAAGSSAHTISRQITVPVFVSGSHRSIYLYRNSSNVNIVGNIQIAEIGTILRAI